MILPLSGCNQIVEVTASAMKVTVRRRKAPSLTSDALLQQASKIEIWGGIDRLAIGGNDCAVSGIDYVMEETVPLFFEQTDYIINAKSLNGIPIHFDHSEKSIREAVSQPEDDEPDRISGVINFGNNVGYSNLIFYDDLGNKLLLEIEVFPSKLSYKEDYEAIRNDINEMVEAAVIDFMNSTYSLGSINKIKNNVPAVFFSLITQLFAKYLNATKAILRNPNHRLFREHTVVQEHKLKASDVKTLQWIVKHPMYVNDTDAGIDAKRVLGVQKRISYDTIENQLVRFILVTTTKKLLRFKRLYLSGFKDPYNSADKKILDIIDDMVAKIDSQLRNPMFEEVSQLKGMTTMSLVFQMAPGYRELFRYFQLIQHGITFSGEVFYFSLKETATLYEYWCFIKLVDILKKRYTLLDDGGDIIKANRKGVTVTLSKEKKSEVRFIDTNTGDRFDLVYNPGEYPSDTVRQVPDNILKLSKCTALGEECAGFQYVLDAKYKVETSPDEHYPDKKIGPKVADINTMHRYRDAIVSKKGNLSEKLMFGAYVLFPYPNSEEEYRSHQFYKSIESVNIGGVPFLPGKTTIAEELLTRLVGESDASAFDRAILPLGIEKKLKHVDWSNQNVLVGLVGSKEQWDLCNKGFFYYVPVTSIKAYHQVNYVAVYQSRRGFSNEAGILYYGGVVKTDIVLGKDIKSSCGCIIHPDTKYYKFSIAKWKQLDSKIEYEKEWVYRPRYTNDFLLNNVKSTFELFNIRSEADFRLVYELRRIHGNMKVQDDSELFVKIGNNIAVYNDGSYIRIFSFGKEIFRRPTIEFIKNPGGVFERIKEYIPGEGRPSH